MTVEADATDDRFPVAVAEAPRLKDVRVEVRCKPVSGQVDQVAAWWSGRRQQIGGWTGAVSSNAWHTLAVEVRGDRLQVFWEGKAVIDVRDGTFGEAGRVGLWTKADSVTAFDGLTTTALP